MVTNQLIVNMPLLINYDWRQTEDKVIVRVPLKYSNTSKVDLFTSDSYIKVHSPPYIFEACLYACILEDLSKCTLVETEVVFELVKENPEIWPCLSKNISKKEALEIKQKAILKSQAKAEEEKKLRAETKDKIKKECVAQQLELNSKSRNGYEKVKEKLKNKSLSEVMKWKEEKKLEPLWKKMTSELCKDLKGADLKQVKVKDPFKTNEVPEPRMFKSIGCDFTYRAFPTPSRESKHEEEEIWLKKQAEARRATGFMFEDLRPEEKDPQWLLEKGKSFHSVGNYLGAVSAFSYAVSTWDKIPELYVARSESQLKLENWRRALSDTTKALELCVPHVRDNEELRFLSHLNRARSLLKLGKNKAAMADLVEALELRPKHGEIEHLMDQAEKEPDNLIDDKKYIEPEDLSN